MSRIIGAASDLCDFCQALRVPSLTSSPMPTTTNTGPHITYIYWINIGRTPGHRSKPYHAGHLASNTIPNKTTLTALDSDPLPILFTYCTKVTIIQQTSRRSFTNYHKANCEEYTREIEQALENEHPPQDVHYHPYKNHIIR